MHTFHSVHCPLKAMHLLHFPASYKAGIYRRLQYGLFQKKLPQIRYTFCLHGRFHLLPVHSYPDRNFRNCRHGHGIPRPHHRIGCHFCPQTRSDSIHTDHRTLLHKYLPHLSSSRRPVEHECLLPLPV